MLVRASSGVWPSPPAFARPAGLFLPSDQPGSDRRGPGPAGRAHAGDGSFAAAARPALVTGAWGLLPLSSPLGGLAYRAMTRSGGGLEGCCHWQILAANPWSPRAWAAQLWWVDPISLAAKTVRPFVASASTLNGLISPAFLDNRRRRLAGR